MDFCVAETQGSIGYLIEQGFRNVFARENITRGVLTLLTQVVVDKTDPAFQSPVKPVGPYYSKEEMRRHDVRPGLTGMAQVHGRNSAAWEKRFEYDVYYVDHLSFLLDIKILFRTVSVVFRHEDIGQGEAGPEAFHIVRQRQWDEAGTGPQNM